MEGNPYSILVQTLKNGEKRPPGYRMGEIVSENPLKVEVSGTVQTSEDLLKNDALASFQKGEQVLLLPIENEQRYIILCKVVST
ncbi:MAG: DUF2577 domain-containing protein [Clostridiales bacterium]|nr:DUF2577 domain-containing protein [Clostridiales bacterium]